MTTTLRFLAAMPDWPKSWEGRRVLPRVTPVAVRRKSRRVNARRRASSEGVDADLETMLSRPRVAGDSAGEVIGNHALGVKTTLGPGGSQAVAGGERSGGAHFWDPSAYVLQKNII